MTGIERSPELITHYDRFVPKGEGRGQKLAYLGRNIIPLIVHLPKDARILEVGPGRGELLLALRDCGFESLVAHECCEAYAADLRTKGFRIDSRPDASDYLREIPEDSLQAIVLVDVLEHMEMPACLEFLEECLRALGPGGRLVLQVPNVSGLFGLTTFTADPTHCALWNELRLKAVLEAKGYTGIQVAPMALPPSFPNRIREIVRGFVFACAKVLARVCGATPVSVLTHNIVCFAEKPQET